MGDLTVTQGEIRTGHDVDAGGDGVRKQPAHVVEAFGNESATRGSLTELFGEDLHCADRGHPGAAARTQHRHVILGEEQAVLDGVDAGANRQARRVRCGGVDGHLASTGVGRDDCGT